MNAGSMVGDGGSMVEEWWETVHLSRVDTVEHRVIRILLPWLMRLNKNSHNSTLFHTILHNTHPHAHV